MVEVAGVVAGGGVFTVLVIVIGYLLRAMHRDREQYEAAVDRAEARADAAEQRTRDVRATAEEARQARYACEDRVSHIQSELAALRRYTAGGDPV